VITSAEFTPLRDSLAALLAWRRRHAALFRDTRPDPEVGVYYDERGMASRWEETAGPTFAVAAALLEHAVPFRFVTAARPDGPFPRLSVVLVPPGIAGPVPSGRYRVVHIPRGALDTPGAPSRLGALPWVRRLLDGPMSLLARAYFGTARARRLIDSSGLTERFLESPLFGLPRNGQEVTRLLPPLATPRIAGTGPLLVERRRGNDDTLFIHIVNYADHAARVRVEESTPSRTRLHSPDEGTRLTLEGSTLMLTLECYAILELGRV
jgi:hypothetical protein